MVWGTNGMMVYPLQSSKIVSKLSGVSKKSKHLIAISRNLYFVSSYCLTLAAIKHYFML